MKKIEVGEKWNYCNPKGHNTLWWIVAIQDETNFIAICLATESIPVFLPPIKIGKEYPITMYPGENWSCVSGSISINTNGTSCIKCNEYNEYMTVSFTCYKCRNRL